MMGCDISTWNRVYDELESSVLVWRVRLELYDDFLAGCYVGERVQATEFTVRKVQLSNLHEVPAVIMLIFIN